MRQGNDFYYVHWGQVENCYPMQTPVASGPTANAATVTDDGRFLDNSSKTVTHVDPRCHPDALRGLGAKLEEFHLV